MMKQRFVIAIFALACVFGCMQSAFAQSNDVGQMANRINQLENQIRTLSRAVFRGDVSPEELSRLAAAPVGNSNSAVAMMQVRLDQLEQQIQQLTGKLEEQNHRINQLSAQRNAAIQVPEMQPLEPAQPLVERAAPPVRAVEPARTGLAGLSPDELYEKSFVDIRDGNYEEAELGFETFLKKYSDHALTANAKYWLAETYYVRGNYTEAAKLFAEGYQAYPDSSKTADNLLKLGLSLTKLDKKEDACLSFGQLKKQFPDETGPIMRRAEQEMQDLNCG